MIGKLASRFFEFVLPEIKSVAHKLREKWLLASLPYGWMILFFLLPFLIIFKISFSRSRLAIPPFRDILEWTPDLLLKIRLYFESYYTVVFDPFYAHAFWCSFKIAIVSTFACLIVGYAIAYGIARAKPSRRAPLLLLVALPFWTSFLIRVYAWMAMLSGNGLLNAILLKTGLIDVPLRLLDNDIAVCLGITYCYLPFMVFPVYASLVKIGDDLTEAAYDLGHTPLGAFWSVTVPLSKPGIVAGTILVFLPAIGEFVIPEILGGADTLTIGRVLWWEFFNNRNWPLACALAVIMVFLFVIPVTILKRRRLDALESGSAHE